MPKKAKELSPLAVKRLSKPGLYAVGGVSGLQLQIKGAGAKSWILRAMVGAKRRDIGLGGYPDVGLAEAREKARQARLVIDGGVDPIASKKAAKSALIAAQASQINFEECATRYLADNRSQWKNAKHAAQWESTIREYAFPLIGKMLVNDIHHTHILEILNPIWKTKTVTAKRLRGRIEKVLDWATVSQYRDGLNPARWRGHMAMLLPNPGKMTKVRNHPALDRSLLGDFMQDLANRNGSSVRALEFLIFTACRSGEARGATWNEIDLKQAIWTIPEDRMKMGKQHVIPLTTHALKLLNKLPRINSSNLLFPAASGKMLSDMALTVLMRKMHEAKIKNDSDSVGYIDKKIKAPAVPHGFRSTFRDWAAENTNYSREVAEQALAHTIKDKSEASYRRGELLEKRRRMMKDWAEFCSSPSRERL